MIKKIEKINFIRIAALLIHAAKIDENYTENEKKIILSFLKSLDKDIDAENVLKEAELEEKNSNQILNFTKEIKKNDLEFKKRIIKILWKIVLSDKNSDAYENTLMRRIAGLLYVPDKIVGDIKIEILNQEKK